MTKKKISSTNLKSYRKIFLGAKNLEPCEPKLHRRLHTPHIYCDSLNFQTNVSEYSDVFWYKIIIPCCPTKVFCPNVVHRNLTNISPLFEALVNLKSTKTINDGHKEHFQISLINQFIFSRLMSFLSLCIILWILKAKRRKSRIYPMTLTPYIWIPAGPNGFTVDMPLVVFTITCRVSSKTDNKIFAAVCLGWADQTASCMKTHGTLIRWNGF